MTYPYAPDRHDPGAIARRAEQAALVSQLGPVRGYPTPQDNYLEDLAEQRAEDRTNYEAPLRGWDRLLADRNTAWAAENAARKEPA